MQEKDIISKIQSLKKIEPNQNWVSLTKSEIFNRKEESFSSFFFNSFFAKSSMTAFASLGFIALLLISAQGAFPGDTLYPVKRIAEKGKMVFLSQENKQDFNILMTHERLEEISEIIKRNQIERLSLAVKELESMKSEMQKDFAKSIENKPKEEAVEIAKKFAVNILDIEDRKEMILGPLGVRVDNDDELSITEKDTAFLIIEDWEGKDLTEEGELLLKEAKDFFEQKNYYLSLMTVMQINNEMIKVNEIEIEKEIEIEDKKENNENLPEQADENN